MLRLIRIQPTFKGLNTYNLKYSSYVTVKNIPTIFHYYICNTLSVQRSGSVRGEDVPYVLGLPLVLGEPFFPHNYSSDDSAVSKKLIHYLSNFVRRG